MPLLPTVFFTPRASAPKPSASPIGERWRGLQACRAEAIAQHLEGGAVMANLIPPPYHERLEAAYVALGQNDPLVRGAALATARAAFQAVIAHPPEDAGTDVLDAAFRAGLTAYMTRLGQGRYR